MPILEMHLMEGRTEEQKQQAAKAVTAALVESLGVEPQSVRILITEHRSDEFYVAGEKPQFPAPQQLNAVNEMVMGERNT